MTSWPWMKGIDVAIADPIDPVCPEDGRPSVKDLIKENKEKIDKVKAGIEDHPLYDANKHDDLWVLRFWLSHKKSKAAIDAAKYTLDCRKEHELDEKDIRSRPPHHVKEGMVHEYLQCWEDDAVVFTHPDPQRGVIVFLKLASMDQHKVVEKCTEEHWFTGYLYFSEWAHQWLDYVTRTTGRLTKSIRLVDTTGLQLSTFNRECSKRDSKAMAMMEDCYPQLLESVLVCNAPAVATVLWKLFRVMLPKRVVKKFDFLDPKNKANERKRLYGHISEVHLPEYYGGKNPKLPTEM